MTTPTSKDSAGPATNASHPSKGTEGSSVPDDHAPFDETHPSSPTTIRLRMTERYAMPNRTARQLSEWAHRRAHSPISIAITGTTCTVTSYTHDEHGNLKFEGGCLVTRHDHEDITADPLPTDVTAWLEANP